MNAKEVRNVVASVLARLRNTSKSNGVPFQQVLQQYAMERFLYRVWKSRHAESVILKGALLLKTIGIPNARPNAGTLLKAISTTIQESRDISLGARV